MGISTERQQPSLSLLPQRIWHVRWKSNRHIRSLTLIHWLSQFYSTFPICTFSTTSWNAEMMPEFLPKLEIWISCHALKRSTRPLGLGESVTSGWHGITWPTEITLPNGQYITISLMYCIMRPSDNLDIWVFIINKFYWFNVLFNSLNSTSLSGMCVWNYKMMYRQY